MFFAFLKKAYKDTKIFAYLQGFCEKYFICSFLFCVLFSACARTCYLLCHARLDSHAQVMCSECLGQRPVGIGSVAYE